MEHGLFVSATPDRRRRGLFRCTPCSDGGIVLSDDLIRHTGGPTLFGRAAFAHPYCRAATLYISVQSGRVPPRSISACSVPIISAVGAERHAAATSLENQVTTDGVGQRITT
jgi:hypothetical protein